ncbi:hypothetical protein RhiirA4_476659 [Rhizophagus irregularis]|uniref:Uncharacterized protein n=1 Tax=Rhizophagus irregularis TaxID=588596 RepID=A0A2I1HBY2_9GLOM|nr:hypothetical protein RhiirA4_476659 [Rhizophagus irregularis]
MTDRTVPATYTIKSTDCEHQKKLAKLEYFINSFKGISYQIPTCLEWIEKLKIVKCIVIF